MITTWRAINHGIGDGTLICTAPVHYTREDGVVCQMRGKNKALKAYRARMIEMAPLMMHCMELLAEDKCDAKELKRTAELIIKHIGTNYAQRS